MTSEDIRFEVRAYLAARPTASATAAEVKHGLARKGHEASADEVTAALIFLEGLSPAQTKRHKSPLGSTNNWQITSAGILAHERNE